MKFIPIIILSLFLQGCGFLDKLKKPEEPAIPPNKVVNIDTAALEYCPLLKEEIKVSTFEQILVEYSELATSYGNCASKQATSVKLIKQLGNIK